MENKVWKNKVIKALNGTTEKWAWRWRQIQIRSNFFAHNFFAHNFFCSQLFCSHFFLLTFLLFCAVLYIVKVSIKSTKVHNPANPQKVHKSPQSRKSTSPQIHKSANPQARKSTSPQIYNPANPRYCVIAPQLFPAHSDTRTSTLLIKPNRVRKTIKCVVKCVIKCLIPASSKFPIFLSYSLHLPLQIQSYFLFILHFLYSLWPFTTIWPYALTAKSSRGKRPLPRFSRSRVT